MDILGAFPIVLTPVTWAFNVFFEILTSARAVGVYIAFFFIYTVLRLFIRPLVGEALSFPASNIIEGRRRERREKTRIERRNAKNGGTD